MHCALRRRRNDAKKATNAGKVSLLRKSSKLNNFKTSLEDFEKVSLVWRNLDRRFPFLTFFTLQPDGQWKMIALPLQCCDHSELLKSGVQCLVCTPMSSFKVDQPNVRKEKSDLAAQGYPQRGHPSDNVLSIIQRTTRNFSSSHAQHQSQNKALENSASKSNELPSESSCLNFPPSPDSPGLKLSGSDGINSSDMSIDNDKVNMVVKKNARKKTRKKGKQKKKLSSEAASALEANSEGGMNESSTSQICANNDMYHGEELDSCGTTPSLPECRANESNSEGDSCNVVNCSEIHKECPPLNDEEEASGGLLPSENGLQAREPLSSYSSGEEDSCFKGTSCYNDTCLKVPSEMPDSLVLDSFSAGSAGCNGNGSADEDKTLILGREQIGPAEPPSDSNSNDLQLFPLGKRGKQSGRAQRNLGVYQMCGAGNSHGRLGRESNHSVWQKVQKNAAAVGCDSEMKKTNSGYMELKGPSVVESSTLSTPEDKNQLKVKASRKLKRKSSPGSKQYYNSCSRKGSQTMTASSNARSTSGSQQNELLNIQNEVNSRKGFGVSLQMAAPKAGLRTRRATSDGTHIHLEALEPVGHHAYDTVSAVNNRTTETLKSSQSKLRSSFPQSNVVEVQSSGHLPLPVGNEASEVDKGVSITDYGRQDHASGSFMQKWIPVGLIESELTGFGKSDSSSFSHMEEPGADGCDSGSIMGEESVSTSHSVASSVNAGDVNCSSINNGQIQNLVNKNTCIPKVHENKSASANLSVFETNVDMCALGTDSEKIARAVNDVCKVRMASEAVQTTNGRPIAEFERFLQSASPVICQSSYFQSCPSCLPDQAVASSLCRHRMPNVSLGSLWDWYEKHGSYGLEVRAEEYESSKRLNAECFAFRAYFVPLLSAVQLFGICKSCPVDEDKEAPGAGLLDASETVETSRGSDGGPPSIFSVLIPQPCTKQTNSSPVVNTVLTGDEISVPMDDTKWSDDAALLFEYFEYEPPQQRRPLYEKIQELVKGDGRCQAYGDPTKLDSMDLHDLHPRSWYSVAWYPIYRIPDGNFRAAFLTYHSLGHLACRTAEESRSRDVCIVSPVVGLQSYNAQGENWFQPKHAEASQAARSPGSNVSDILKERLRTLEKTAALMARAAVSKGDQSSVNRHPDYEFFLSRRRH